MSIKQVIKTSGSDQRKINTILVLNIDSFKDFKKEFAKANIADSYWEDANNLSFMKHANAYVAQPIAFYQLALAEYINANMDTLDEIQAQMEEDMVAIGSNASPQETEWGGGVGI